MNQKIAVGFIKTHHDAMCLIQSGSITNTGNTVTMKDFYIEDIGCWFKINELFFVIMPCLEIVEL